MKNLKAMATNTDNYIEPQKADIRLRISALILTSLFILSMSLALTLSLSYLNLFEIKIYSLKFFAYWFNISVFLALIENYIQGFTGRNFAKTILGLKLLDDKEFEPIGWIRAGARWLFSFFSIFVLGLGYISVGFNIEKKSLHDFLVSSNVYIDEHNGIQKGLISFVRTMLWYFSMTVIFCFFIFLAYFPYAYIKSLVNESKYLSLNIDTLARLEKTKSIKIQNNGKVVSLLEYKQPVYIEFEIERLQRNSYISKENAIKLGAKFFDHDLSVNLNEGVFNFQKRILVPNMIIKDSEGKDILVKNAKFTLSDNKNILAADILSLVNNYYSADKTKLYINSFKEDLDIIQNEQQDENLKNFLLYLSREIRIRWQSKLKYLPIDLLSEFNELKQNPKTEFEVSLDPKSGFIIDSNFSSKSDSVKFNDYCKKFIEDIGSFKFIPNKIRRMKNIKLKLSLNYQELSP